MKNFRLFGLLTIVALLFCAPQAQAIHTADRAPLQEAVSHHELSKKELRKQKRMEKRLKKMQKKGIDFSDPIDKWLWFAILGWGASLVLYIVARALLGATFYTGAGFGLYSILSLLAFLLGLFSAVSLVIWLIKKFG